LGEYVETCGAFAWMENASVAPPQCPFWVHSTQLRGRKRTGGRHITQVIMLGDFGLWKCREPSPIGLGDGFVVLLR
jgi:hypothetical protein